MAEDISAFGLSVRLLASNTFPVGFNVTQFADDSDPLDIASLQIADNAMGLNGDLVSWSTANPILMTLNVIPGSDDDRQLAILFEANRVGRNKRSARDTITGIVSYPDGSITTVTVGLCREYMPGKSVASAGRLKSKAYIIAFENKVETP